jgi:hypothetical protein
MAKSIDFTVPDIFGFFSILYIKSCIERIDIEVAVLILTKF